MEMKIMNTFDNEQLLLELLHIKRIVHNFLENANDEEYINSLTHIIFCQFFSLMTTCIERESFSKYDDYIPDELQPLLKEIKEKTKDLKDTIDMSDEEYTAFEMDVCLYMLRFRIYDTYGNWNYNVLMGEFLRIIEATIDYMVSHKKIYKGTFEQMFLFKPKLNIEHWDKSYCCAICKYPWNAFELVTKLKELMHGKRDKEALLYVYAGIEAGVLHRSWKYFKQEFGTTYCKLQKTYNQYTNTAQRNQYYTEQELKPLIAFFKKYLPPDFLSMKPTEK